MTKEKDYYKQIVSFIPLGETVKPIKKKDVVNPFQPKIQASIPQAPVRIIDFCGKPLEENDYLILRDIYSQIGGDLNKKRENERITIRENRIKGLILNHNRLYSLPSELFQLDSLDTLRLNGNLLSSLPPEIGQLKKLQDLSIVENRLKSLPPEIGQLKRLQNLYLDYNKIRSLPSEIGQLTELQYFYATNNTISSLPPEIGQLTELLYLTLTENKIKDLPSEIKQLNKLMYLDLYSNPLSISSIKLLDNLKIDIVYY